ncbi:hypothetical protein [uncultured Arcticibacterium sp.]|uniref:hypothetical protein n=1 Tax=uncultured Arcticibacterium sp. TaxID=2173042 RepID=UPI0030FAE7D9
MNRNIQKISTLFFASVLLFSCSKSDSDDVEPATKNAFVISDQEFALDAGLIENYGETDEDVYDFDITLYSSSVTVVEEDGEYYELAGEGNAVYLDFSSSSASDLTPGTYSYSEGYEAGTFAVGVAISNANFASGIGTDYFVESGSVTVDKDGDTYTITFDVTLDSGEKMTGSYTGVLKLYDYTSAFAINAGSRKSK